MKETRETLRVQYPTFSNAIMLLQVQDGNSHLGPQVGVVHSVDLQSCCPVEYQLHEHIQLWWFLHVLSLLCAEEVQGLSFVLCADCSQRTQISGQFMSGCCFSLYPSSSCLFTPLTN